jgi:hypothetical protein
MRDGDREASPSCAVAAEVWAWLRGQRPTLLEQVRQLEVVDEIAEDMEAARLAPKGKGGE